MGAARIEGAAVAPPGQARSDFACPRAEMSVGGGASVGDAGLVVPAPTEGGTTADASGATLLRLRTSARESAGVRLRSRARAQKHGR
jgi:hypothetical protein